MLTYIALLTFTEKGQRDLKKTTARSDAFNKIAEQNGIKIKQTYWLNGPFDGLHVFEVENEQQAMAHSFSLCSFGNVKTQTFRAYTKDEIEPILELVSDPFDLLRESRD